MTKNGIWSRENRLSLWPIFSGWRFHFCEECDVLSPQSFEKTFCYVSFGGLVIKSEGLAPGISSRAVAHSLSLMLGPRHCATMKRRSGRSVARKRLYRRRICWRFTPRGWNVILKGRICPSSFNSSSFCDFVFIAFMRKCILPFRTKIFCILV